MNNTQIYSYECVSWIFFFGKQIVKSGNYFTWKLENILVHANQIMISSFQAKQFSMVRSTHTYDKFF